MTKRIVGILVAVLMVMALVPVSAFAQNAKSFVPTRDTQTWDFEGSTDGWTFVDDDGDGHNWALASVLMAGYIIPSYSGADCLSSQSYDSDTGLPLTPDNWAISPAITADDLSGVTLTFWAQAQDADYASEHFGVAVGNDPTPETMVMVQEWTMTASVTRDTGNWYQYSVNLTDVEGVEPGTIYFAIRHFNCSDWFYLNVDLVEVTVEGGSVEPTDPPVDPTEPVDPPAEGFATVILNVPEDHWQDGTGYQMLLDADATAYGTIIPETGALTTGGDVPDSVYAQFEYKIPENADGALSTSNIVSVASVSIEIPAGVYDWCITNPTPGDRMWIAAQQGNVGGRQNDYEFLDGYTYEFVVTLPSENDAVNVTITDPNGEQPPVPSLDEALNVEGGHLHFETSEDYPWEVFQDGSRWAAWSGNKGVSSSVSTLTTTVTAVAGDTVSFDFMAWGEGSYSYWDHCDFYVNEEQVLYYGALDNDWEPFTYTFEADGEYTLTWSYTKDSSVNPTGDYFAIDEVDFSGDVPVDETPEPTEPVVETPEPTEPVIETPEPTEPGEYDLDYALNTEGGELHFESTGEYPWVAFEDEATGRIAAWSTNNGVHSSTSVVSTAVTAAAGDTLSFDFKAWGEGASTYFDKCEFRVNGQTVASWGKYQNEEWETYTYTFEEDGEYTLEWAYTKDSSVNQTGDYFAVDEVIFTGSTVAPTEEPPAPTEVPGLNDLDRALNITGGSIHFESTGTYPWVTVTEGDRFYAKSSNEGVASSESTVTTTVEAAAGDIAQFEFKAWGEGSYTFWDHCDFFVNGTQVFTYGAYDNDWEQYIYIFPSAGTYTLTWTYTKDSSVNPSGDYFAVDNVYVGEPVHVEEIVATEELTVPVNRTGRIEWTVLPEAAANKAVTFTSDDTSIATVNENGVVFGVSEGETFVTIASVEDPTIFAVCEVTVIDTGLTQSLIYGICTYDFGGTYDDTWVNFSDVDPGTFTTLGAAPGAYAACYAYGTVFGYTTGGDFFTADINNLGAPTFTAGAFTSATVTTMTFDYVTGTIYAMGADDYNSYLFAIDPASGAVTTIATISNHLYGICADENGVIYGIDSTGALYTVDKATGAQTLVGNTGVACSYVQDICYDFNTGDIYWAQILAGEADEGLYRVDKNSAVATYCGALGPSGAEIVGMFIIPDEEPGGGDEVPVTGITINPAEVTIHVGDTAEFTASVQPFNATNKNVEWSVDDEDIIMVDQNGTVIGLAEGTAMVCVTTEDGGYNAFAIVNVLPPLGNMVAGYYFEESAEVNQWTFIDHDGDGFNWVWNLAVGWDGFTTYEGQGIICSQSYDNDSGAALTPDNWAVSPAMQLGEGTATATLWFAGQDPSWAAEHFMIYAGTTPDINSMVPVSQEYVATGEYQQAEADLSQFCGGTVYLAIRHFNVTDMFILNIDQVEIWGNEGDQPPVPTHLWGDADGDGDVDSVDVLLLMRYAMNLIDLDAENLDPWCDVNGDGVVNMTDALLVARYVNGTGEDLPCF